METTTKDLARKKLEVIESNYPRVSNNNACKYNSMSFCAPEFPTLEASRQWVIEQLVLPVAVNCSPVTSIFPQKRAQKSRNLVHCGLSDDQSYENR